MWGSRKVIVPLFAIAAGLEAVVVAGVLGIVDQAAPLDDIGRLGIFVFLIALGLTLNAKLDRNREQLKEKIDHSVGDVYDAGGRAMERRMKMDSREAATVHRLAPRR